MKMVRYAGVVSVVAMALLVGCHKPVEPHLNEPVEHGPMCAAIQTASEIEFSKERSATLQQIASDPSLSEHEQEFLVDATLENQGYSGDNTDVLVALASNPSLTKHARDHLVKQARRASLFSDDRARLAKALAANPSGVK
jgi:hypothetical protein